MPTWELDIGYWELTFTTRNRTLFTAWVASRAKSPARLHTGNRNMIRIIRMALALKHQRTSIYDQRSYLVGAQVTTSKSSVARHQTTPFSTINPKLSEGGQPAYRQEQV